MKETDFEYYRKLGLILQKIGSENQNIFIIQNIFNIFIIQAKKRSRGLLLFLSLTGLIF